MAAESQLLRQHGMAVLVAAALEPERRGGLELKRPARDRVRTRRN